MLEFEQRMVAGEILELKATEVAKDPLLRKLVTGKRLCRSGHKHLPTIRCRRDPRRLVDRNTNQLTPLPVRLTAVNSHAHSETDTIGPFVRGQAHLRVLPSCERCRRALEHGERTITLESLDPATMEADCIGQDAMVLFE
jgi:hypothetical protein